MARTIGRRYYVLFEEMISEELDRIEGWSDRAVVEYSINNLAMRIATMFQDDNPRGFDLPRFREAAGLTKSGRNCPAPF